MTESPNSAARKDCRSCGTWWRGTPTECPTCGSQDVEIENPGAEESVTPLQPLHDREAHRQVARIENFAQSLYALPVRFADHIASAMHPYDVADALTDLLAPRPTEEPLAEWERELLYGPDAAPAPQPVRDHAADTEGPR